MEAVFSPVRQQVLRRSAAFDQRVISLPWCENLIECDSQCEDKWGVKAKVLLQHNVARKILLKRTGMDCF